MKLKDYCSFKISVKGIMFMMGNNDHLQLHMPSDQLQVINSSIPLKPYVKGFCRSLYQLYQGR